LQPEKLPKKTGNVNFHGGQMEKGSEGLSIKKQEGPVKGEEGYFTYQKTFRRKNPCLKN